jgi:TfoX/Sxy family transcriptional regulator of competence genes
MATSADFITFVMDQVAGAGAVSSKKMFGEYMVYLDGRACFLVCDDTVFVKILPETTALFEGKAVDQGYPYDGAKLHYVLDIEDGDFAVQMIRMLAKILPLPKK